MKVWMHHLKAIEPSPVPAPTSMARTIIEPRTSETGRLARPSLCMTLTASPSSLLHYAKSVKGAGIAGTSSFASAGRPTCRCALGAGAGVHVQLAAVTGVEPLR
ncbi:hypothetical protein GCM10010330_35870 [Streptomyces tendae]|nr:hypothetical protein GCM10010330_35870 [Streptomyces tendae]